MVTTSVCSYNELSDGDIILRDIYSKSGVLLCRKNTEVTSAVKDRLFGYSGGIHVDRRNKSCSRQCTVEELGIGDYIDRTITDKNGVVLVKAGTCVDRLTLLKLSGYSGLISVFSESDMPVNIEEFEVEDAQLLTLDNDIKERVKTGVEYIFADASSATAIDTAKDLSGILCQAVKDSGAVSVDLELLKVSDEYTFRHSVDVATLGAFIGLRLGMKPDKVQNIALAGLLHDLGKREIPLEILNKPGRLTDEEFNIMKKHPLYGYDLVKRNNSLSEEAKLGILTHHEKVNSKGYWYGLDGKHIPELGRILAVVDVYDALVTERPYKSGMRPIEAIRMMRDFDGHFDMRVFHEFMSCLVFFQPGSQIKLSNGDVCIVTKHNEGSPTRPCCRSIKTGRFYDLLRDANLKEVEVE